MLFHLVCIPFYGIVENDRHLLRTLNIRPITDAVRIEPIWRGVACHKASHSWNINTRNASQHSHSCTLNCHLTALVRLPQSLGWVCKFETIYDRDWPATHSLYRLVILQLCRRAITELAFSLLRSVQKPTIIKSWVNDKFTDDWSLAVLGVDKQTLSEVIETAIDRIMETRRTNALKCWTDQYYEFINVLS